MSKYLTGGFILMLALILPMTPQVAQANEAGAGVTVDVGDFSQMKEVKRLRGEPRRATESAIHRLAEWLAKQAEKTLPDGQTLQITLLDVDLAGEYEPGHSAAMQDVRIVRDIYPPRIELSWVRADSNGATLDAGETTLRDFGFLSSGATMPTDRLRFEKRLLRKWLDRQVATAS